MDEVEPRLLSVEEQEKLIPDDLLRTRFMQRPGIAGLPPHDQAFLWQKHLAALRNFRKYVAETPAYIVRADGEDHQR